MKKQFFSMNKVQANYTITIYKRYQKVIADMNISELLLLKDFIDFLYNHDFQLVEKGVKTS